MKLRGGLFRDFLENNEQSLSLKQICDKYWMLFEFDQIVAVVKQLKDYWTSNKYYLSKSYIMNKLEPRKL